jgi:hypothetical protein
MMAIYRSGGGMRPVGIALIVENEDGNLSMVSSTNIVASEVEVNFSLCYDEFTSALVPWRQHRRNGHDPRIRLTADCYGATLRTAAPSPEPSPVKGIYLPDLSFKAIGGPKE